MSTAVASDPPAASATVEALWTVEDVARYLRAGRSTILLWVKNGRLPQPKRVGRQMLWDPSKIRSLVEEA